MVRATERAYAELQQAYDFYNQHLFSGQLPDCLITFQRGKKTMGYFSARRFVSASDSEKQIDEIALNPEFFPVYPLIEIMQTLVHEQCHMWQHHFGNPSRKTYHNKEWADKMETIGLMPSSTGAPGGAKVGQHINDYPIPGGRFQAVTLELFRSGFALSWFDRFPARVSSSKDLTSIIEQWRDTLVQLDQSSDEQTITDDSGVVAAVTQPESAQNVEELLTMALVPPVQCSAGDTDTVILEEKPKTRHKYSCPECRVQVWGKPGLKLICGDCKKPFDDDDE
ncbi:SprT-like domain-containing protein [Salmonella enterica]|nr:SprT-like domain-containing protein [Salmonella enterica]